MCIKQDCDLSYIRYGSSISKGHESGFKDSNFRKRTQLQLFAALAPVESIFHQPLLFCVNRMSEIFHDTL